MQTHHFHRPWQWLIATGFLLLLALGTWSFASGTGGDFIFDDEPNLTPWRQIGDIDTARDLLTLATSGNTVPGRPLALASFAIDDQSWPPDIPSLKRTNLALHLLNGALVFWLSLLLLRHLLPLRSPPARAGLALFVTAAWLLHPLQVSNVSYVIQRMNQLSTLLILTGLLLFLRGREWLHARPWHGALLASAGIGLCMPLAVLTKENGLLLCAFALLAEAFCFPRATWRWWPAWRAAFLWLPLAAFVAYCLWQYHGFMAPYPSRNFNAWERLLTQGPVLVDYLSKLLLPRLHGSGLYYDNFPVARSLLDARALLSWGVLLALIAGAWVLRRRLPLVAFGIFFYFVGHLMESTLLPLEIYFEHRNYLPQLGLWLALAGLADLAQRQRLRRALAAAAVLLALTLAVMTRQNAALWSNTGLQATVWYHDNPGSMRTTLTYSNFLVKNRRLEEAGEILDRGRRDLPDALIVAVAQKYVRCYLQDRPETFDDLPALARHARYETASLEMLKLMWRVATQTKPDQLVRNCAPASTTQLAAIYAALLENPHFVDGRTRATLYGNLAAEAHRRRDLDATVRYYDQAFASEPNPLYAFEQAMALLSAGLPGPAAEYAAKARGALTLRMRLIYPAMEANLDGLDQHLAALKAGTAHE